MTSRVRVALGGLIAARRALRRPGRIGALVLGLLMIAAPALAYFTMTGTGSGSATTGTLQPLVILSATAGSPSSSLLPGSNADLLLRVQNPNSGSVNITSVAQAGGVTVVGNAGCTSDPAWPGTLGSSGVTIPGATGLSIPVAGGATTAVHVANAAAMNTSSVSACQGATFQIAVTIGVSSP
jgi:hypothetical protein